MPQTSNHNDPARERALQLLKYLWRLASLRTTIIRDIQRYKKILWMHEIPQDKNCFTQARGRREEISEDIWIEVKKSHEPALPSIPEICKLWADEKTLRNTEGSPVIQPEITVPIEVQNPEEDSPQTYEQRRLEDHPEIEQEWTRYLEEQWNPWAEDHRHWQAVQTVYTTLFAIRQEQQRLGEEYELVLGMGLLNWRTPSGQTVRRHFVTARASLDFDLNLGQFTVGPDPDGTKLSPELDMLEADEQPLHAQRVAMEGLSPANDNPWERTSVNAVLNGLVHALDPGGEYHESLEPGQSNAQGRPVVTLSPALILRKRSFKGIQETLRKISLQLSEGIEIPPEFLNLVEGGVSRGNEENRHDEGGPNHTDSDPIIYFPKHSNEEQRQIIKTLRTTNGVLVQGPPGTGKSHTIANLICHLLATGKRVLVTAQTPRALKVLHKLLPQDIRPLCISLLGSGNKEQQALQESVNRILYEDEQGNEANADLEVTELKNTLQEIRKAKAKNDRKIRKIRESETEPQSIPNGAYRGTTAKIARQLDQESAEYQWLEDRIQHDQPLPVSPNDLQRLWEALNHFTPEVEAECKLQLPTKLGEGLISGERFRELVQQESKNKNYLKNNQTLLDSQMGQTIQRSNVQQVQQMIQHMEPLVSEIQRVIDRPMSWIKPAVADMLAEQDRPWTELRRVLDENMATLRDRARSADQQKLDIPGNLDRKKLLSDAEGIKRYLDGGGKIRRLWILNNKIVRQNEMLIKKVRMDGHLCDSPEVLDELIEYLSVEQTIKYLWNMWKGRAERQEETFLLQVAELETHLEALTQIVGLAGLLRNTQESVRVVPVRPEPVWHNLNALRDFLEVCQLVSTKHELQKLQETLDRSLSRIRRLSQRSDCHPLTHEALRYMQNRDVDSYDSMLLRLMELQSLSERLQWTKKTLNQLSCAAPNFAKALETTPRNPSWAHRIASIEQAWNWARAHSWIHDFINTEDISSLERQAKQLEEKERDTLEKLAAKQAWKFCFTSLQPEHRRHLVAWQQAIRRIGRGTGKHAPRHRRDAQRHLNKCREAVPAWVMPLYRLWETVDPSPGMFDVIITDEASQCGPESLPLMYLGEKLLVVGDDQQISPEAVGINFDAVDHLRQEYLTGFDHADSFGMSTSLFDHGKLRFGNRIVLREHFRCMPEIIRFSNDLCYHDTPLIPLRQYPPERLEPLKIRHVPEGHREGDGARAINRPEAEALVEQVIQCCQDDVYAGKTMGVIVLQGTAQAHLIETMLVQKLGAEEMENRRLICGNPYDFQGDERDIIFLSMVAAPNERIGAFTKEPDKRRFNVAASRGKDQMWLFHTATQNDLNENDLRGRLLDFFQNPLRPPEIIEAEQLRERARFANHQNEDPPTPFESWFEVDVYLAITAKGYRVIPQYPIGVYRIDLVVEGRNAQLAVECDGDRWHGPDQYEADMERQRKLERAGWQFCRIRECLFYANRKTALNDLWDHLKRLTIFPSRFNESGSREDVGQAPTTQTKPEWQSAQALPNEQQIELLNRLPINREALSWLKKAKVELSGMHVLNLLHWGLGDPYGERGGVFTMKERDQQEFLGTMALRLWAKEENQMDALKFLVNPVDDPDFDAALEDATETLQKAETPEQAAMDLTEMLHEKLMTHPTWMDVYPPNDPDPLD